MLRFALVLSSNTDGMCMLSMLFASDLPSRLTQGSFIFPSTEIVFIYLNEITGFGFSCASTVIVDACQKIYIFVTFVFGEH